MNTKSCLQKFFYKDCNNNKFILSTQVPKIKSSLPASPNHQILQRSKIPN